MKFQRISSLLLVLILVFGFLPVPAVAAKPDAPEITVSNILSSGCIRLTWDAVENGKYYRIYRSATKSGSYTKIKTTSSLSYTDKDAQPGETWYYLIKTVTPGGSVSSSSEKVSGTAKLPRPTVILSGVSASGKIKVSWKKIDGASSYRVYRSTDKSSWKLLKKTTSRSYTDESAVAGQKYYYRVLAVLGSNTAGNSAYSSPKSRTCDLPRPVVSVSNNAGSGRVTLRWEPIEGAVRYRVYRAESEDGKYTKLRSPEKTVFTDTSASEGVTYYYKVMATAADSGANSAYSLPVSGTYVCPSGLTLTVAVNEASQAYLSWNAVSGAAGYRVYRSYRSTEGFKLLSTRTALYYTNTSAPAGVNLYYYVEAVDKNGNVLETSAARCLYLEPDYPETVEQMYVCTPSLTIYQTPETVCEAGTLRYMDGVQLGLPVITREDGSWYRVFLQDQLYYLWSSDINESLTDTRSSLNYTGNTVYQQQVIDLALEISEEWNTIYAHEQSNGVPNADGSCGFDCSGLTSYIFNRVMQSYVPTYRLYAALETQYATTGMYNDGYPGQFSATDVAAEDLQPGDILFFTSLADGTASTEIGHCGIYLGNNEFIHATSSWEDAVCIMGLRGSYLENYVGARRYLPEAVVPANTETSVVGNYKSYSLYAQQNSESTVVATIAQFDPLTVLFTDNDLWAYVRTKDGTEGFLLAEHLGEYEYLEYVELYAALNEESKPALTWNKVKNAQTYEVYRSIREAEGYSLLSTTTNTYYTNNTVPQGMTLYYKVRALDAAGEEVDVSDAVSVNVPLVETEVPVTRYVNVSSVKLYELPETAAPSVTVRYMEEIQLGCVATGSWRRAFLDGKLYYLYMTEGDGKLTGTKSSFSYTGNTALQQEVLDLATDICLNWNTVYATGQSDGIANADGTYGFNAPGLVKYIFNTVMEPKVPFYQLSQVLDTLYTTTELYSTGYPGAFEACDVEETAMEPGDVLFFGDTEPTYCGIYLGNGEFIYCAASWSDGVCIMPLKDFADVLIRVRRYLPEEVTVADTPMTVSGPYRNYKIYAEKSASSIVVATPAQGDILTVLYTDCGNWAMVQTSDGTVGYFLTKYLV